MYIGDHHNPWNLDKRQKGGYFIISHSKQGYTQLWTTWLEMVIIVVYINYFWHSQSRPCPLMNKLVVALSVALIIGRLLLLVDTSPYLQVGPEIDHVPLKKMFFSSPSINGKPLAKDSKHGNSFWKNIQASYLYSNIYTAYRYSYIFKYIYILYSHDYPMFFLVFSPKTHLPSWDFLISGCSSCASTCSAWWLACWVCWFCSSATFASKRPWWKKQNPKPWRLCQVGFCKLFVEKNQGDFPWQTGKLLVNTTRLRVGSMGMKKKSTTKGESQLYLWLGRSPETSWWLTLRWCLKDYSWQIFGDPSVPWPPTLQGFVANMCSSQKPLISGRNSDSKTPPSGHPKRFEASP